MYLYREKVACTYCIIMPALLRLTFRHFFAQLTVLKKWISFLMQINAKPEEKQAQQSILLI